MLDTRDCHGHGVEPRDYRSRFEDWQKSARNWQKSATHREVEDQPWCSTREIATATGWSHTTIERDLAGTNVPKSGTNGPAAKSKTSRGAKGYSTRDIAGITGWDYTTISRDLKRVADATKSVANATPAAKSKTSRGAKDARAAAVAAAADEGGITWEQQHDPAAAPGSRPRR